MTPFKSDANLVVKSHFPFALPFQWAPDPNLPRCARQVTPEGGVQGKTFSRKRVNHCHADELKLLRSTWLPS
jgi:hypothetical protein